jgi:hypothetical protein
MTESDMIVPEPILVSFMIMLFRISNYRDPAESPPMWRDDGVGADISPRHGDRAYSIRSGPIMLPLRLRTLQSSPFFHFSGDLCLYAQSQAVGIEKIPAKWRRPHALLIRAQFVASIICDMVSVSP